MNEDTIESAKYLSGLLEEITRLKERNEKLSAAVDETIFFLETVIKHKSQYSWG